MGNNSDNVRLVKIDSNGDIVQDFGVVVANSVRVNGRPVSTEEVIKLWARGPLGVIIEDAFSRPDTGVAGTGIAGTRGKP